MDRTTEALHVQVKTDDALPASTPLYQCSAFRSGSRHFYTRKNNPNVEEFEDAVRALEGCQFGVGVASGMAAISLCVDLLAAGDLLVIDCNLYGCSYRAFHRYSERRGLRLEVTDLSLQENVDRIPAGARMVFFETPTNPFLKTISIAGVRRHLDAVKSDALIVVDNTWATPLYQRPLDHGADVSVHSGTKYFSGHSDVMGGIALTNREDLSEDFRAQRFYGGAVLDPHSAWLLRRSLQTFSVRIERQRLTALAMVPFLEGLPQVSKVYYPQVDGKQLAAYGGIIFFELREDLVSSYNDFAAGLVLFGTGTGMAGVTSTVAQPYTGSHASMTDEEKKSIGLDRGLVRLCFGLEDEGDLRRDLESALASIDPRAATVRQEG